MVGESHLLSVHTNSPLELILPQWTDATTIYSSNEISQKSTVRTLLLSYPELYQRLRNPKVAKVENVFNAFPLFILHEMREVHPAL